MSSNIKQAHNKARTKIARRYFSEYQEYYKEIKGDETGPQIRSKADSEAKTRLANKYRKEYTQYVEEHLNSLTKL